MVTANEPVLAFFLLLCGHAIGDFALQNQWVAYNKSRRGRTAKQLLENAESSEPTIWPYLLTAHALHHGFLVFLITQKGTLALAETVVHWISDFGKGEEWYGFHMDQFIHIFSKAVWVLLLYFGVY